MERYETSRSVNPLPALLLGFGIGVVSTIIYAAAREERFNRIVKRTQDAGTKVHETADHWRDTAVEAGHKIQEAGGRVKETVKNVVASVKGTAHDLAAEIEESTSKTGRRSDGNA